MSRRAGHTEAQPWKQHEQTERGPAPFAEFASQLSHEHINDSFRGNRDPAAGAAYMNRYGFADLSITAGIDKSNLSERSFDRQSTGSERRHLNLNGAIVDLPSNLDPSRPIHFMTYFNGHRSSYSDAYQTARLSKQMQAAPPNTVLISARWQDQQHSSNSACNNFMRNGGLQGVLNQVFREVPELQRTHLQRGDTLGLTGFSAGYVPVSKVLADRSLASRVTNIVMLDSPSSAVQRFVGENLHDFSNGTRRLSMVAGKWRAADYANFANTVKERLRRSGLTEAKGFIFNSTRQPHDSIPAQNFMRAAWESTNSVA